MHAAKKDSNQKNQQTAKHIHVDKKISQLEYYVAGLNNYVIPKSHVIPQYLMWNISWLDYIIMPYKKWCHTKKTGMWGGLGGNAPDRAHRDRSVAAAGRDTHKSTKKSGLQKIWTTRAKRESSWPYWKIRSPPKTKLTCPSPRGLLIVNCQFHIDPLTSTAPLHSLLTPRPQPHTHPRGRLKFHSVFFAHFTNTKKGWEVYLEEHISNRHKKFMQD